ncbi:TonB-dependent receptor plug domain-containing protein [Flagellimonas olearia]|uniref:TonB-dependent receptor plug domain-containing protein n=1 Tax=Flagellimonas olearia TaxID=552546 RepID=A0A6I1DVN0_9FLAO|nr:TonB-dependent receptor plug domain-containing protein [Allomuricauda olearia]KAB7529098.1 TonB-dependent receptor plug domain-containing protein [Allomuricauda olearia]
MKYFMAVCSLLVMGAIAAQDYKGQLVTADGSPLEDAGIFNKTNGQHSHTDGTGHFVLDRTSVNDTIYFSRLGYATQTKVVRPEDLQQPVRIVLNESSISLDQVVLVSEVNALSRLVDVDVKTNPVKSSQEILRKVPGLIIGQHAGGGKAEQIFLRGFDVDHGTDVAINVDGMPVNMVSHAHGQGYADLHFVIPETIENVNFGKGPYYMEQGDFNTAGYVDLRLRKSLSNSMVSTEVGQFDTRRFLGMFNVLEQGNSNAYLASELYLTNGPVESPQNFNRLNILGRYRYALPGDQELLLTASHFQSKWDASGQIPQRAVDQGLISRFGSIDDTEGGQTSRTNFVVNHNKNLSDGKSLNTMAFLSQYDFELYSNFTFFLDDTVNGDQIKQYEDRMMLGARTVFKNNTAQLGSTNFKYQAGIGFRYDNVDDNELSHTLNRQELLERLAYGDVDEVNSYAFAGASVKSGKFTFEPALRLDYFKFDYVNKLSELYDNRSEEKVAFSPKFNTIFSPTANTQFFLKTGMGFHSNDARVVVANQGEDILPTAYGVDLGTILKPVDRLVLNATVWSLFLDQEFVYVGDAGVVEPSGKTRRFGLEVGARYQPFEGLYLYTDANYTHARSTEEANGEDYIPLAPDFTVVGGFTAGTEQGFSGGLNYRYLDDRPANEDNSIVAEGYFVTDATLNYGLNNWTFSVIVENLFDTEWNETQFATESRLFSEPSPVEEIHFTPGMPFYLRGKVSLTF